MSLPRTRPLHFTVGVDGGSVRRSGSRLALGQRQRKEKQTKSTSTHVPPPQGLCGDRVFRLPEHSAGSTGPSAPAGPIRPTPVFRQISPGGGVLPLRRFSLPPAAAQKVNCPEGAREAPLEGSLLSRQKRMGADPPRGPRAPRPARRVRAAPADTLPVPGPLIRPAFGRPPSPKGEGDSPWISATFLSGEKALRGTSDEVPSSVICSANATFPRLGKALRQGSCSDKPAHRPCRRNQPGPVCKKKSGAFAPLLPRPYKALRRSPRTGRGTAASAPPSGSR